MTNEHALRFVISGTQVPGEQENHAYAVIAPVWTT